MFVKVQIALFIKDNWQKILILPIVLLFLVIILISSMTMQQNNSSPSGIGGTAAVSEATRRLEPLLRAELEKYNLQQYTEALLALIEQESGGQGLDPMQSSESVGLPPNTIDNIEWSILQGVSHFKNVLDDGTAKGVDFPAIIQSYNMGRGYVNYVAEHGGKHSEELAKEYSWIQVQKNPSFNCGGNVNNFRYPYCFGDFSYATKVLKNLAILENGGGTVVLEDALVQAILNEGLKYQGQPYTWAGYNPQMGFDCSGLMQWIFSSQGIKLPRTAQEQYNMTERISREQLQPGDLVFFHTASYNDITHVGLFVGNDLMYDSHNGPGGGNGGVDYTKFESSKYWSSKIVGYGRVRR